jgi:hypothetical protein
MKARVVVNRLAGRQVVGKNQKRHAKTASSAKNNFLDRVTSLVTLKFPFSTSASVQAEYKPPP